MLRFLPFAVLLTAGCFDVNSEPSCTFQCGSFNNNACPDDYSCASDGYCHKAGFVGSCDFPAQDMSVDISMSRTDLAKSDLGTSDLATTDLSAGVHDMAVVHDLTTVEDLTTVHDMTVAHDLTTVHDMTVVHDLTTVHDLAVVHDLTVVHDMACNASACTSPPSATCNGASATTYPSQGTCNTSGTCSYAPTTTSCTNGCYAGSCTTAFTGFTTTTATQPLQTPPVVALATSTRGTASIAGGPAAANVAVLVTTATAPTGTVSVVTATVSTDPTFATNVQMIMATRGTPTSATSDTWTIALPAAPASVQVYFYLTATPYNGTSVDSPTSTTDYTYANQ